MSTRHGTLVLFLFCVIITLTLAVACGQPEAEIESVPSRLSPDAPALVTGGQVRGALSDANPEIIALKGVPFAAPPVGDLRWRPPEPVVVWEGVRDGSSTGRICPQAGGQAETQSEDCLFLNVWAPRKTVEAAPVMVWIHGGGYRLGSGSSANYDGTHLASKGVVLVTINYRLNVFGFLAHSALSAESEHGASGNYGLMDMVAALEWVRDNIATFGGDPQRVTIFGESAGGGAVMSLMLVPQAEGLFHRAIAESTYVPGWDRALRGPDRGWESAEEQGIRVAEALGATGNDPLATMRAALPAEVLEAAHVGAGNVFTRTGNVWAPNVDGWVIPDDPLLMYDSGRQHDVPLIAGMNDNEGSLFRARMGIDGVSDFESHVRTNYAAVASEALAFYDVTSEDDVNPGIDHLIHDMFFAGPVRAHLRAHAQVTSSAWLYHFAQVPPTAGGANWGSHHAAELPYVFGTMNAPTPWTDADRGLSETMMAYWTQFAATGNPNRDGLPPWPAFEVSTDEHLTLAETVVSGIGLHREGAALFDAFEATRRAAN